MNKIKKVLVVVMGLALIVGATERVRSATLVDLNTASSFAVLAGATVSDTGVSSTIIGNVGLSPTGGTAITILSCTDVTGTIYDTNAGYTGGHDSNVDCLTTDLTLLTATKADVSTAYNDAKTQAPDFAVTASTTDSFASTGYTLAPGVYNSSSTMGVPIALTLDGGGDPDAVFIFQAGSTLSTVSGSTISLINGAKARNVFWQVGSSATLGTGSTFKGTIMSAVSITDSGGSTIQGRLLADADNNDADSTGTVALNNTTVTVPTTLHVVKVVVNDDGGTTVASGFNLHVKRSGTDVAGSPAVGASSPGTEYSLSVGTYVVSEDANASYAKSFSGDCNASGNVTLLHGDNKTCTITNNDIAPEPEPDPATLHIVKTVVNDNGGTSVASDFTIDVSGTNVSSASVAGSASGVDVTLDAGAYAVTETSMPGYLQSGSGDCSGRITAGETKTCTITNDDIAPQLIVNKIVVNDNGGTQVISDFPLFIDGIGVTSGVATTTTIGSHTVSETSDTRYTSSIGGNCATDGTITLALGDVQTCTVTNNDIAPVVVSPSSGGGGRSAYHFPIPPIIDVVKVPNPLALPNGPGVVEYSYILRNAGTVPVTNITMVGDTCVPVTLMSGDTNANNKLEVDEAWVYTCSTTLTKTHTNIITATGWASGMSTTDIANATVIVGLPIVPPLIHVTKVPSPLIFSAGGGMVTYIMKVTNPGTVALSHVKIVDDTCVPVNYLSGDTNNNSKLDTTETWTYACSSQLTQTTVNTVTASGEANGLTARDFAIVTVVVDPVIVSAVAPKLPNAGVDSSADNAQRNIFVTVGILAILVWF